MIGPEMKQEYEDELEYRLRRADNVTEVLPLIISLIGAMERDAVGEARLASNDWRTTARQLGRADGFREAVRFLTGIDNSIRAMARGRPK